MRLSYRASLAKIMQMSIYDNKPSTDIQFALNEFMFNSGKFVWDLGLAWCLVNLCGI